MTALDRYVRLESDALWREAPDAQRRDVVISFGNATLVIADQAGRPLAHWSLTALNRLNAGERPAVYAPDEEESELLEIADATMIDAIEEVRRALAKSRPRPGKLRLWLTLGVIGALLLVALLWLPGALTRQALAIVPQSKRVEIGTTMLSHMQPTTGRICQSPRAAAAAARFRDRLFGAGSTTRIVIVPRLSSGALALPGGLIVVEQAILQQVDDPAAAAGFIIAARPLVTGRDPLAQILAEGGLGTTLRLLTTGEVDDALLQAQALLWAQSHANLPEATRLADALAAAEIPLAPYRSAIDARTGTLPDLGPDPLDGQQPRPILNDSDWVSLRNACDG
jgi:hypothetical protein